MKKNGKYYCGIGSRATPDDIQALMLALGCLLGRLGYCLRSGGADGADKAFESGADIDKSPKEIFIPWKGFNGNSGSVYPLPPQAFDIVNEIHPAPHKLTDAARRLHARNCQQILGPNLDSPSAFVICWTPGGEIVGGTATAIRLAMKHNIPVCNLGNPEHLAGATKRIQELKKEVGDI